MASSARLRVTPEARLTREDVLTLRSAAALMRKDASLDEMEALDLLGVRERREQVRLARELPAYVGRVQRAERPRPTASRPLLASVPKKVSAVTGKKARQEAGEEIGGALRAGTMASEVAPLVKAGKTAVGRRRANDAQHDGNAHLVDPMELTRMWMSLGMQMAFAAMTMQARLGRTMLNAPVAALAFRQGDRMLRAFAGYGGPLALFQAGSNRHRD